MSYKGSPRSKNRKACLLMKGASQYDAARVFLDEFRDAFERLGYNCYVVDMATASGDSIISRTKYYIEKEPEFVFAVNTQGFYIDINGRSTIFTKACGKSIPFISYMVDAPFYHYDKIRGIDGIDGYSFINPMDAEFVQNETGIKSVFIPHGGSVARRVKNGMPTEKKYDLLFSGSLGDENGIIAKAKAVYSKEEYLVFEAVVEHLDANSITIEEAIELVCNRLGIEVEDRFLLYYKIGYNEGCGADIVIRARNRKKAIEAIGKSGHRMTIYGNGDPGDNLLRCKNLSFKGPISYPEIINKMAETKIVLNAFGSFRESTHERMFTSMINGAALLSNTNPFLEKHFRHNEDLLLYSFNNIDAIGETIYEALNDEALYNKIITNAKARVEDSYTWDANAKRVIELVDEITG